MLDQEDEGTRIAIWVVVGVLFLVLVGVIGGVVLRHLHGKAAPAAPVSAAAPAAVAIVAEEIELIEAPLEGELVATLTFEVGKADLGGDASAAVDAIVAALAAAPARRIVLSGFHDASGDPAFNAELAKQRAIAVREALLAAGAEPARVQLRKPESTLGGGSDEEARRVEARLVD